MERSRRHGFVSAKYITSTNLADTRHSTDSSDIVPEEAAGPRALIMCKEVRCETPKYMKSTQGLGCVQALDTLIRWHCSILIKAGTFISQYGKSKSLIKRGCANRAQDWFRDLVAD